MRAKLFVFMLSFSFVASAFAMDDTGKQCSAEEGCIGRELHAIAALPACPAPGFSMPDYVLEDIETLLHPNYKSQQLAEWLQINKDYFRRASYCKGVLHTLVDLTINYEDEQLLREKVRLLMMAGAPVNEYVRMEFAGMDGERQYIPVDRIHYQIAHDLDSERWQTPLDRINCLMHEQELHNVSRHYKTEKQDKPALESTEKLRVMHQILYSYGARTSQELRMQEQRDRASKICFVL